MAIYHCSVKVGSRSKGQSAIAAAAYRAGEKLTDHETGFVSDYTKKCGVVYSEIALCENAPVEYADRQTLWSAVHQIEKAKDARLPVIFLIAVGIWTALDFEERKWVLFADKVSIIVIWSGIGISFVFGKQLSAIGLNTVMLPIAVYLLYVLARWLFETGAIDGLANLVTRLTDWWHDLEPNEKQGNALLAVIFIIAAIMVYRWIA